MSSPITRSPFSPLSLRTNSTTPPIEVVLAVTLMILKSISETVTSNAPGAPPSPVTTPCASAIESMLGSLLSCTEIIEGDRTRLTDWFSVRFTISPSSPNSIWNSLLIWTFMPERGPSTIRLPFAVPKTSVEYVPVQATVSTIWPSIATISASPVVTVKTIPSC